MITAGVTISGRSEEESGAPVPHLDVNARIGSKQNDFLYLGDIRPLPITRVRQSEAWVAH